MDSTTLPSPGAKPKYISPACAKRKIANSHLHHFLQPLLPIPVAVAPSSPEVQDAGHGAPALQNLESKCCDSELSILCFWVQTIQNHVTFGNEKSNASKNTATGKIWLVVCFLKKKCLSAVNQPLKNSHEEENNSPSAKTWQQHAVQGKYLQWSGSREGGLIFQFTDSCVSSQNSLISWWGADVWLLFQTDLAAHISQSTYVI